MALVTREITAAKLADADTAIDDIRSWFDPLFRCSSSADFDVPAKAELRSILADTHRERQRIIGLVDTAGPTVVGLTVARPQFADAAQTLDNVRIRWLLARPNAYGAIAARVCSDLQAKIVTLGWTWAHGVDIWGCVENDTVRTLFTATGKFGVVTPTPGHFFNNYPAGSVIRYTGG